MAKKQPTLLDAAKSLPKARIGQRKFHERLTPEQQAEFFETVEWYRGEPPADRAKLGDVLGLMKKAFGSAPSESTFRNYVNEK